MPHRRLRGALLALALAVAATGCTRAMQVGSEPSPVYRLSIVNEYAETMIVSYNDGRGDSMLGAVPAGRTDTFVVAGPASASVMVSARNTSGSRTFGPRRVDLVLGESVTLRLLP